MSEVWQPVNKEKGLTLVEVMVVLAIAMIILGTLSGVLIGFVQMKVSVRKEQDTTDTLHYIAQFIQDECHLAEAVCVEISPSGVVDGYTGGVEILHPSHESIHYDVPMDTPLTIKRVIFDPYKYNRNGLLIHKVLSRTDTVDGTFKINYQSNLLDEAIEVWTLRKETSGYWMTIGYASETMTFYMPFDVKAERSEPWVSNAMY